MKEKKAERRNMDGGHLIYGDVPKPGVKPEIYFDRDKTRAAMKESRKRHTVKVRNQP